jgi:prefoldin subunit 5
MTAEERAIKDNEYQEKISGYNDKIARYNAFVNRVQAAIDTYTEVINGLEKAANISEKSIITNGLDPSGDVGFDHGKIREIKESYKKHSDVLNDALTDLKSVITSTEEQKADVMEEWNHFKNSEFMVC